MNDPLQAAEAARVDLTNCDREPIHQLGRVQSYGALLAISSDWIVQHASTNLGTILGVDAEAAIGRPLTELIVSDGFDRIRRNLRTVGTADGTVRLFGVALKPNGKAFDVSVHQSGAHLIVEFEPKGQQSGTDTMSEVYPLIQTLRNTGNLNRLASDAAVAMRSLCGFDSVMVYQFQPDAAGKVIAEDRADRQPRYNGMMFPASDIPAQARLLYKRSLLRLIADVRDPGAPIVPGSLLNGQPLDLSLAVTRSVSPIHIEYLGNMGVEASMSVSIMKNGELWGLFACHHATPRYIDYERRTAIEMFAHLFSYELSRHESDIRHKAEADTLNLQTLLMAQMADGRPVSDSLISVSEDIRNVIPHDGMILYSDGEYHATGSVPTREEFVGIARMLDANIGSRTFSTDQLSKYHPAAADYARRCAGILAIPISKRPRDYIVLCRRQVAEQISWAGDPTKPVTVGPNGTRLTPRKSFEMWQQDVLGRSQPWMEYATHAAEMLRTILLEIFLKITDAASEERKRAQEHQQLLISELNHRVRNILNLMRGLVSQSRQSAHGLSDFTENLDGRIHSLARAHDQLTAEKWEPTSLKALIATEFEAYAIAKSHRVKVTGADVMVSPKAYTALALVLHEMVTNSIKYGALCDSSGRIDITLSHDVAGALMIEWKERGGPPVQAPTRRGFGSTIIQSSIPHELQGDAEVDFKLTGLEARFRVPAKYFDRVEHAAETDEAPAAQPVRSGPLDFTGNVLVLEDTMLIAMDAAGIFEDLGATDVKICASVKDALAVLDLGKIDFALLDVNLGDEQSTPVAEELTRLGIPYVLATGYGDSEEIRANFPPSIIVQKPFHQGSLKDALSRAVAGEKQ